MQSRKNDAGYIYLNSLLVILLMLPRSQSTKRHRLVTLSETFLTNIVDNGAKQIRYSVAWKKFCRPKFEGSLGIRRAQDVNAANMAKSLWRILTEADNIWVQVIQIKYKKKL